MVIGAKQTIRFLAFRRNVSIYVIINLTEHSNNPSRRPKYCELRTVPMLTSPVMANTALISMLSAAGASPALVDLTGAL